MPIVKILTDSSQFVFGTVTRSVGEITTLKIYF